MFSPLLSGDKLVLARLPNAADISTATCAHVGTLAVEPTFIAEVARGVASSTDREIARLRERASGTDQRFFWGTKRGETVLLRRGQHGDQLIVAPGGGHR